MEALWLPSLITFGVTVVGVIGIVLVRKYNEWSRRRFLAKMNAIQAKTSSQLGEIHTALDEIKAKCERDT